MATNPETGHAKNVANFETLITYCKGYMQDYDPSNNALSIESLKALYSSAKIEINNVAVEIAPFNEVEGLRKTQFKNYKSLATKIMGALQSCGAPQTVVDDAETINRKMQGKRAPGKKIKLNKDGTPKNRISVSQQSYDMKIEHLDKMIELLAIEKKYKPNEEPLKVQTLRNYKQALEAINLLVKEAYVPYERALISRNKKLYTPIEGLVPTALIVKKYVMSIYGATTPEYKNIKKLSFRNIIEIK